MLRVLNFLLRSSGLKFLKYQEFVEDLLCFSTSAFYHPCCPMVSIRLMTTADALEQPICKASSPRKNPFSLKILIIFVSTAPLSSLSCCSPCFKWKIFCQLSYKEVNCSPVDFSCNSFNHINVLLYISCEQWVKLWK